MHLASPKIKVPSFDGTFSVSTEFRCKLLRAAYSFYALHSLADRGLREVGSLLEFFENSRALVLLLETPQCSVDRLILLHNDADQSNHLPSFFIKCFVKIAIASWKNKFQKHVEPEKCIGTRTTTIRTDLYGFEK